MNLFSDFYRLLGEDKEKLYQKSRRGLMDCLSNEKDSLSKEINCDLDKLIIKDHCISVCLYNDAGRNLEIEIVIKIHSDLNIEIGKYILVTDLEGNFIDEFLVWQ